jgi:hypothetical protein
MPLVIFDVTYKGPPPCEVSGETCAVRAAPYVCVDDEAGNPGGVTRADLNDDDIRPLGAFKIGDEVFIEGLPQETLNVDDETGRARIWWRALITGPMVPGGTS